MARSQSAESAAQTASQPSPKRRWRLKVLLLIVAGSLVGGPLAVESIPALHQMAVRLLLPDLDGTVSLGGARVRWWSPVALREVTVRGSDGEVLLEIAELSSRKSLLALCLDPLHAGEFRCRQPRAHVIVRPDGSNLEDALRSAPDDTAEAGGPGSTMRPEFSLIVEDGAIDLRDADQSHRSEFHKLNLRIDVLADAARPLKLAGTTVCGRHSSAGELKFDLQPAQQSEKAQGNGGDVILATKGDRIDLANLNALLIRCTSGVSLSGQADVDMRLATSLTQETLQGEIAGRLTVQHFTLRAPGLSANERLELPVAEINARLALDDHRLEVKRLALQSDLVRGELAGHIDIAASPGDKSARDWLATLNTLDARGTAQVDVAQLAAMLPQTLKLRSDVTVSQGVVRGALRTTANDEGRQWQAQIDLADLTARVDGHPLVWDQPIKLLLTAHAGDKSPVLDTLRFESQFLEAAAAGSRGEGRLRARCDLNQFARQAGQFIALEGIGLAGRAAIDAEWRWPDTGAWTVDARGAVDEMVVSIPSRRPCREQHLEVTASFAGQNADTRSRLEGANFSLTSGGDKLQLALLEPLSLDDKERSAKVRLRIDGSIPTWLARVPFETLPAAWRIGGSVTAEGMFDIRNQLVVWDRLRADLENPDVAGDDWRIREPLVKIESSGGYDSHRQQFDLPAVTLSSHSLSLRGQNVSFNSGAAGVSAAGGTLAFKADLARLLAYLPDAQRSSWGSASGVLEGRLQVAPAAAATARPVAFTPHAGKSQVANPFPGLKAQGALSWPAMQLCGLQVGPAKLELQIDPRQAALAPVDLTLGGGKLHVAPQVLLDHEPALLKLEPGPLLEKVHLTPELCAGWLRFVAPLLAESTQADGQFSVDLTRATFPLGTEAEGRPYTGDAAGVLKVHAGQVLPGGIARNLVEVARQFETVLRRRPASGRKELEALLTLPEQQVDFSLTKGRVEHRGLTMRSGDVTIRTHGSVGLDETLALVAELPIPDDWVANDKYLKGLQGQTLQVPISGTLQRPQIDSRALAALTQKLAGSAAESAVEGLIQDQLKRLLPRGR